MTLWSVALQVPLSMGFPGKNTRVGGHFLLQGIVPTQGSNPGFPHCRWILYQLSHKGGYYIATLNSLSLGFSDTTDLTYFHSLFLSSPYFKGDDKNKSTQLHVKKVYKLDKQTDL